MRRTLSWVRLPAFKIPPRAALLFSARATLAALAAWWIAIQLKLDNPQWAAVTVWIVAQPSRGMTLSKGFYRLLGTALGAIVSIFMIVTLGPNPWLFTGVLALWLGLCAAVANTVLYFQSYGAVLAGYTAPIVGLLVFSQTDHVIDMALDRIACVMLGIVVASVFASLLAKSDAKPALFRRIRLSVAESMELLALICARAPRSEKMRLERFLVAEAGSIEEMTAYAAAESMQIRFRQARAHNVIASLLSVLSAARGFDLLLEKYPDLVTELTPSLEKTQSLAREIAGEIRQTLVFPDALFLELRRELTKVTLRLTSQTRHQELLVERTAELTSGIDTIVAEVRALTEESNQKKLKATRLSHHRDWKLAQMAGLRAAVGVLIAGAIWQLTGWHNGPILLMMAAVNCGVFAMRPDPVAALVSMTKACAFSYAAAAATHYLFLSGSGTFATSLLGTMVAQIPFLIPGGILMANPATSLAGTLYAANYEVFLAPRYPAAFDLTKYIDLGLGFFAGAALSIAVFRYLVPAHPRQHVDAIQKKIVNDLCKLAEDPRGSPSGRWETRMYHRIGRMISISTEFGGATSGLVEGGLAALQIGRDILVLRGQMRLEKDPKHSATTQILTSALQALPNLRDRTPETIARLRLCSAEMRALSTQDPALERRRDRLATVLEEVTEALHLHQNFFLRL